MSREYSTGSCCNIPAAFGKQYRKPGRLWGAEERSCMEITDAVTPFQSQSSCFRGSGSGVDTIPASRLRRRKESLIHFCEPQKFKSCLLRCPGPKIFFIFRKSSSPCPSSCQWQASWKPQTKSMLPASPRETLLYRQLGESLQLLKDCCTDIRAERLQL